MPGLISKPTQASKVLEALRQAKKNNNGWVSGQYFLHTLLLSQYHARIFELEKQEYIIERGAKDEFGFCSYRLTSEPDVPGKVERSAIINKILDGKKVCCYSFGCFGTHDPKCKTLIKKEPVKELTLF